MVKMGMEYELRCELPCELRIPMLPKSQLPRFRDANAYGVRYSTYMYMFKVQVLTIIGGRSPWLVIVVHVISSQCLQWSCDHHLVAVAV